MSDHTEFRPPHLNDALAYAIAHGYDQEHGHDALHEIQAIDDLLFHAHKFAKFVSTEDGVTTVRTSDSIRLSFVVEDVLSAARKVAAAVPVERGEANE